MMEGKSMRLAEMGDSVAGETRVERLQQQLRLHLSPESSGAMEGLRQEWGRSHLYITKNKKVPEDRPRGNLQAGTQVGSGLSLLPSQVLETSPPGSLPRLQSS